MASSVPRDPSISPELRRFLDGLARDVDALQTATGTLTPLDASYVTLGTNATLTSERVLTAGSGISLTDAGAGLTLTVASTVTPGGLTVLSYAGGVGTGATYTVTGLGGYKAFMIFLRDVSHNSGSNQSFRVELSSDAGSNWSTPISPHGGAASFSAASAVNGVFFIGNVDQSNNQIATIGSLFQPTSGSQIDATNRGATNALRFSFSGGNFDNGSIDIYGLK